MVLGVGFLLLVSLLLSAALAATGKFLSSHLPGGEGLWQILNFIVSFAVITVVFAMLFKYLPDVKVEWRDVWVGAAFTSVLFVLGKFAIGLYLGKSSATSVFGAAGSLVVILIWIYYSAQILFFGAEFTQVYATSHGSHQERLSPTRAREDIHAGMLAAHGLTSRESWSSPEPKKKGSAGKVVAGLALGGCVGLVAGAAGTVVGLIKGIRKMLIWK